MAPTFRILGQLEVRTADRVLELGGKRHQTLLALLLLNAGTTVSFDLLIDELWNPPPTTARRQVINIAAAVRRRIEQGTDGTLVKVGHGYRIEVTDDAIDAGVFGMLVRDAGSAVAGGRPDQAVDLLYTALSLWRGTVLSGLSSSRIEIARHGLTEQRLQAVEQLAELRLGLGELASLIPWLVELVGQYPVRESLRATLMRALHRAGRSADALAVFAEGSRVLADEFGTDPGAELRDAHELVLRSEAKSTRIPAAGTVPRGRCFLPGQLPDFVGREADLERIALLAPDAAADSTTVITIEGMGGVGKTALAVQAAYRLRRNFPDGQYFVDLRGFDEHEPPVSPDLAVDVLLRQSGVPAAEVPSDPDGRRDLWRAHMAEQRSLVVLDNAADAAQLRPLLPPSRGSLVLVTSRRQLPALDGVVPLTVGVLDTEEAAALFQRITGTARTAAEPRATAEVVALCGGLPLAIRIAASRLGRRPAWTVAYLAEQLRAHDGLVTGDRSVTGAITLSYRHLALESQRLFRLLGLVPGPDFDARAAAALSGTLEAAAAGGLEELLECNLLQQETPGRYRLHDLVRVCARALAADAPADDHTTAMHRLLDYYLGFVHAQCEALNTRRHPFRPELTHVPASLPRPNSERDGVRYLEAEYDNLIAATVHANAAGWYRHAWQLPCVLLPFMIQVGCRSGMLELAYDAVKAARKLGDRRGESAALANLAVVLREAGRPDDVHATLERAIEISRDLGDTADVVVWMNDLGAVHFLTGRLEHAAATWAEARDLARARGDHVMATRLTANLVGVDCKFGRYETALGHLYEFLDACRREGETVSEVAALINIGWVGQHRGDDDEGTGALERAYALSRATGYVRGEVRALAWLAVGYRLLGRVAEAVEAGRAAVELGHRSTLSEMECDALNGLAEAYLAAGDRAAAERWFRTAEQRARASAVAMPTARAVEGLAHLSAARGDRAGADRLWRKALAGYPPGVIEARGALAHLSAADGESVRCGRCRVGRVGRDPDRGRR